MKDCADCSALASIGSRCPSHWIDRQARLQGIRDWLWWKNGPIREHLLLRIPGRYEAIAEGFGVPTVAFLLEDLKTRHHVRCRANEYEAIVGIVEAADKAARREHERRTSAADSDRFPSP